MTTRMTRRGLLRSGLQMTVAGAVVATAGVAQAAEEKSCLDGKINEGLASSLNFTAHSTTPNQTCGNCGLFNGDASACGQCQIFSATVNPKGHCDSWAAK
jgi:High potential iron-sulfur protein